MVEPLFCNIKRKSTLYRCVSDLFGVCSYFILGQDKLIIIDPGKLEDKTIEWLNKFNNLTKVVYITHEHFDHHYHANKVLNLKQTILYIPTVSFSQALMDPKKNLSYYYNQNVQTFSKSITDISYLKVLKTPGHSRESYCFLYDDIIFGGDTIINTDYLVLKLPGSSKVNYKKTIEFLNQTIPLDTIVMPGHGNYFFYSNWNICEM